jgi:hypothetical protein
LQHGLACSLPARPSTPPTKRQKRSEAYTHHGRSQRRRDYSSAARAPLRPPVILLHPCPRIYWLTATWSPTHVDTRHVLLSAAEGRQIGRRAIKSIRKRRGHSPLGTLPACPGIEADESWRFLLLTGTGPSPPPWPALVARDSPARGALVERGGAVGPRGRVRCVGTGQGCGDWRGEQLPQSVAGRVLGR